MAVAVLCRSGPGVKEDVVGHRRLSASRSGHVWVAGRGLVLDRNQFTPHISDSPLAFPRHPGNARPTATQPHAPSRLYIC